MEGEHFIYTTDREEKGLGTMVDTKEKVKVDPLKPHKNYIIARLWV